MVDRYEMYYDSFDNYVAADVEDNGSWVSYDDYKALAARIEQLEVEVERIARRTIDNWVAKEARDALMTKDTQ